jgi:hypothetical protein
LEGVDERPPAAAQVAHAGRVGDPQLCERGVRAERLGGGGVAGDAYERLGDGAGIVARQLALEPLGRADPRRRFGLAEGCAREEAFKLELAALRQQRRGGERARARRYRQSQTLDHRESARTDGSAGRAVVLLIDAVGRLAVSLSVGALG